MLSFKDMAGLHGMVNNITLWGKQMEIVWWCLLIKGKDQCLCDHLRLFPFFRCQLLTSFKPQRNVFLLLVPLIKGKAKRHEGGSQTSSNKKLYNGMYEQQPGGNVAVPVSTKLILTIMLLSSFSSIPSFLTASVGMPRYVMETGWGPIIPGVAFQSHLCWQQRKTRVELFYLQSDS